MDVATVVGVSAVMALVGMQQSPGAEPEKRGFADLYVSSRHDSPQSPVNAAACVARNAEAERPTSAQIQPIYGMEKVAVVVSDRPVGDTLAVVYLAPAGQGSRLEVVTTRYVDDREALVTRMLVKC